MLIDKHCRFSFTSSSSLVLLWSDETESMVGQMMKAWKLTYKNTEVKNILASRFAFTAFVPCVFLHLRLSKNKLSPPTNNRIKHTHTHYNDDEEIWKTHTHHIKDDIQAVGDTALSWPVMNIWEYLITAYQDWQIRITYFTEPCIIQYIPIRRLVFLSSVLKDTIKIARQKFGSTRTLSIPWLRTNKSGTINLKVI